MTDILGAPHSSLAPLTQSLCVVASLLQLLTHCDRAVMGWWLETTQGRLNVSAVFIPSRGFPYGAPVELQENVACSSTKLQKKMGLKT